MSIEKKNNNNTSPYPINISTMGKKYKHWRKHHIDLIDYEVCNVVVILIFSLLFLIIFILIFNINRLLITVYWLNINNFYKNH